MTYNIKANLRQLVVIHLVILTAIGCAKDPGLSQTKILAIGESTTAAAPGYRKKFLDLAKADNLIIDMLGPNSDGAQLSYDGDHAGFRGTTCSDLVKWIGSGEVKYSPDIVILWQGTNDCGWGYQFYSNQIIYELSLLVDRICTEYPNARVFVGSVPPMSETAYGEYNTPTGVANQNVVTLNNAIPEMVNSKVRDGKKVHFVDARSILSVSTDISPDGVHPNQIGYDKMGALFYNAVHQYLSTVSGKN